MHRARPNLLAWVYALLIAAHAWVAVQLARTALPGTSHAAEQGFDARSGRELLTDRIHAAAASIDRALLDRAGLPVPADPAGDPPARAPATSALPPELAALQLVIARTRVLEARATALGWKRFAAWIDGRLDLHVPAHPTPRTADQLGRMSSAVALTFLADRDRDGRAYPAALEALRAEIEGNADQVSLRLLALKMLRRLGPQVKENGRAQFVSLARNESARGGRLVPDEAVESLLEVARRNPELRAELHRHLWGVDHPLFVAELRDALEDPRPVVREGALRSLSALLEAEEGRRVLLAARELEPDAALRALIDRLLTGR